MPNAKYLKKAAQDGFDVDIDDPLEDLKEKEIFRFLL